MQYISFTFYPELSHYMLVLHIHFSPKKFKKNKNRCGNYESNETKMYYAAEEALEMRE